MPFFLLFFAGTAIAGWICAMDQSDKRNEEQQDFRSKLGRLEQELKRKEDELAYLQKCLGSRNHQVRRLLQEVEWLRQELADLRRQCA